MQSLRVSCCVPGAQGRAVWLGLGIQDRERRTVPGAGGHGRTVWSLPAMTNNPLTTTKARACPIRTDASHRWKQGFRAPAVPDAGFGGGPRIPEWKE